MKVDPRHLNRWSEAAATQRSRAAGPAQEANRAESSQAAQRPAAARVEISSEARELQAASQAVDPARAEKLASLREAVTSGTYRPDPRAIAERMLRDIEEKAPPPIRQDE